MRWSSRRRSSAKGFTLIEMLVAVAIGAFILTAITTFIFSMAELWGAGANERLFKKHTRGVSRFLEYAMQTANARYEPDAEHGAVYWMNWEGDGQAGLSYLSFELERSPGALVWPADPMPHVVCSLDFDPSEGLFLLWRSRLEEDYESEAPRRTLVSPFVKELRYHYIDYELENPDWEILTEPKQEADRSYVLPQRVELVFRYQGQSVSRHLSLPMALPGVPSF